MEKVSGTPVASISLGASRVFAFTKDAYFYDAPRNPALEERDRAAQFGLWLHHRDLLVMQAKCNLPRAAGGYAHALLRCPEDARPSGEAGVRFNLTFRVMQSEGAHKSAV